MQKIYEEKGQQLIYKIIDTEVSLVVDEFLEKKGLEKKDMVTVKEIDLTNIDYNLKNIKINWGFSKNGMNFILKRIN